MLPSRSILIAKVSLVGMGLTHVEPLLRATRSSWVTSLGAHTSPVIQVLTHFPDEVCEAYGD